MIPQVGGFQGCYLDNHRDNWRRARAVRKRPHRQNQAMATCPDMRRTTDGWHLAIRNALALCCIFHISGGEHPTKSTVLAKVLCEPSPAPAPAWEGCQGAEAALVSRGTTVPLSTIENPFPQWSHQCEYPEAPTVTFAQPLWQPPPPPRHFVNSQAAQERPGDACGMKGLKIHRNGQYQNHSSYDFGTKSGDRRIHGSKLWKQPWVRWHKAWAAQGEGCAPPQ